MAVSAADRAVDTASISHLVSWFRGFADVIEVRADELSSLDAAIGDADHGTNMRRGCRAVVQALDAERPPDVAGFGRTVGMRLISAVGGASGPLYGSFFMAFGSGGGSSRELDAEGLARCWRAGIDDVAKRGKAVLGEKTMLDALIPAVEALEALAVQGESVGAALAAAAEAAEQGMRSTIPLVARKGRASYLGERSVGHQDPGATSSWLLIRAAAAVHDGGSRGA